jgi:hypothetical protein
MVHDILRIVLGPGVPAGIVAFGLILTVRVGSHLGGADGLSSKKELVGVPAHEDNDRDPIEVATTIDHPPILAAIVSLRYFYITKKTRLTSMHAHRALSPFLK